MITDCATKTITSIEDNSSLQSAGKYVVKILCVSFENQNSKIDRPTIFSADMLDKPKTINKTSGVEGELLLTHTDNNPIIAEINPEGEMIIYVDDDDDGEADKYSLDPESGNLIYNDSSNEQDDL